MHEREPRSNRCGQCGTDWPLTPYVDKLGRLVDYLQCPDCLIPTYRSSEAPLTPSDARSIRHHILFERYYADREDVRLADEAAREASLLDG